MKSQKNELCTVLPTAPEDTSLQRAIGLIPYFAGKNDRQSHIDRLRINDDVVRVYSMEEVLLVPGTLDAATVSLAMEMCKRSAWVRYLLIPNLLRLQRFDLVELVKKQESQISAEDLNAQLTQARIDCDFSAQVLLLEKLFLETGNRHMIREARDIAREHLKWADSWKTVLRVLLTGLEPTDSCMLNALRLLELENNRDMFSVLAQIGRSIKGADVSNAYGTARLLLWDKRYDDCMKVLEMSGALNQEKAKTPIFVNIAAKCQDKMGNYRLAADYYIQQGKSLVSEKFSPERYLRELEAQAAMDIGALPKDVKDNVFIMTGFPRSGTTLLENALASHAGVATCEETSSLISAFPTAYQSWMPKDPERKNLSLRALVHRELYYKNLQRYVHNEDAQVIIDKTPILSSNIRYLEKLFPQKHYVFSIRHPYDVVLSNFRQEYGQNVAMSAFNDFRQSCVLYNYVMSAWFEVFPGETDRVHYVRYDDLVNDFETVVRGTLEFLKLEWDPEVLNFAENAGNRAVRTPSYANVRQGLGMGVQTSWRNYDFLFDEECRALLAPWVERFEYEGI